MDVLTIIIQFAPGIGKELKDRKLKKEFDVMKENTDAEIVVCDLTALAVMTKAEIDSNVATAKLYPRSMTAFRRESLELVTLTEKIAEDCIFALPRGSEGGKAKFIEGPSVRFSEMIVSAFGNCRSGARIIGEERQFVIAEGFFHDLEKNVAIRVEIKRRITNKKGERFNSDMIAVTGNAACSIARRNAALQGIPKAIWDEFYQAARATAVGDVKTIAAKRADLMVYFQKLNVAAETIFEYMGVKGIEDIGIDELLILRGIATAIKEGTVSVDNAFRTEPAERGANAKELFKNLKTDGKVDGGAAGTGPGAPAPEAAAKTEAGTDEKPCEVCGAPLPDHHDWCSKFIPFR